MAEILARKRAVTMTALRRHQRQYGGPCDLYLRRYLELGKILAPATLAGRYGTVEDLSLFAPALFLRPPHPIYEDLAVSIRTRVRERLATQLRNGHDLSDNLFQFDGLLSSYIWGCREVATAIEKKRTWDAARGEAK